MIEIINSWQTPVVRGNQFFDNQQEIIDLARTSTTQDDKTNNKFVGGIPFIDNPIIAKLKNWILESVHSTAKTVNRWDTDYEAQFLDIWSWSSVDYDNNLHGHHNCSWSGIYCLEEGDASNISGYNGSTLLFSPLPWGSYTDPGNLFLEKQYLHWHHLNAGDLLLFPSYVRHSAKYKGTTPRTIIAFNIIFK
jgi:hypothetical protein